MIKNNKHGDMKYELYNVSNCEFGRIARLWDLRGVEICELIIWDKT